jgi:hypothetical protein
MEPKDVLTILNALEKCCDHAASLDVNLGKINYKGREIDVLLRDAEAYDALAKYNPEIMVTDKRIRYLKLAGDGIRELPEDVFELRGLVCLDVSNTPFEATGQLERLVQLRQVDLSQTNVSDVQWMASLPVLEDVRVRGTKVSDLRGSETPPFLRKFDVYNTKIDWEDPAAKRQLLYLAGRNVEVTR